MKRLLLKAIYVYLCTYIVGCGTLKYNGNEDCNYYDNQDNKIKIQDKDSLKNYPNYQHKCMKYTEFQERSIIYQSLFYIYDFSLGVLTVVVYTVWFWIWFV